VSHHKNESEIMTYFVVLFLSVFLAGCPGKNVVDDITGPVSDSSTGYCFIINHPDGTTTCGEKPESMP